MRNYVICLLILIPILSFGNLLSSKVKHVTVFHLGSEIVHEIDVNLKKGNNTIQVKGVSNRIIEKTTQIIASEFLLINCKKVKSIETNNRQDDQIKVFEDELKIIENSLKKVDISNYSSKMAEYEQLLSYFETKSLSIRGKISALSAEMEQEKISDRLNETDLQLLISCNKDFKDKLTFKYVAGGAGWSPKYEFYAQSASSEVTLKYYASIMNNTGIDWEDVSIELSSAFPIDNYSIDFELEPWYLGKYANPTRSPSNNNQQSNIALLGIEGVTYSEIKIPTSLSTTTKLPGSHNVLTKGGVFSFPVMIKELKADFVYYLVPDIQDEGFLTAQVKTPEDFMLIDGIAKIFYNKLNVGNSKLLFSEADSIMNITLGSDNAVVCKKEMIGDEQFNKVKLTSTKETFSYTLTVKNQSEISQNIILKDQVPISQTNKAKVEIEDVSGGIVNANDGITEWKVTLKPGKTLDKKLKFTIDYSDSFASRYTAKTMAPRYRTISCPSF
jgi:uncharacterized protein (TIGR02231 family)